MGGSSCEWQQLCGSSTPPPPPSSGGNFAINWNGGTNMWWLAVSALWAIVTRILAILTMRAGWSYWRDISLYRLWQGLGTNATECQLGEPEKDVDRGEPRLSLPEQRAVVDQRQHCAVFCQTQLVMLQLLFYLTENKKSRGFDKNRCMSCLVIYYHQRTTNVCTQRTLIEVY